MTNIIQSQLKLDFYSKVACKIYYGILRLQARLRNCSYVEKKYLLDTDLLGAHIL